MRASVLRVSLCAALLALVAVPAQAQDAPVSRLPLISDEPTDPLLKQLFDETRARGGKILNLHRTQGLAPKLAKARRDLAYAIRFETKLPAALREMAIIRTSQILDSEYERNQHIPLAKVCGVTDAQLGALEAWESSNLFDDKARSMLRYVEAMILAGGEIDDEIFAALSKQFSPQEIVEITIIVGNYFATGLLTKALKVKVDPPGAVPGKC